VIEGKGGMQLPVIIMGPVYIGTVESGTVLFGDVKHFSPRDTENSVSGQGSGNSGAMVVTNNGPDTNPSNG
jgi:hypothetical protein